jgi:hypothetical protein
VGFLGASWELLGSFLGASWELLVSSYKLCTSLLQASCLLLTSFLKGPFELLSLQKVCEFQHIFVFLMVCTAKQKEKANTVVETISLRKNICCSNANKLFG